MYDEREAITLAAEGYERVLRLSYDRASTLWFDDFVHLIDEVLYVYRSGRGYQESSLAEVNVNFRAFRVRTIEETEAYTIISLLSDIGGALGLWLGGTALSIYEIFALGFFRKDNPGTTDVQKLQ
uniref:Uncharacterized protein n=1 Tax=Plectus sambesii TaxID=2011161 RepID=A0A914WS72_9BILA